MDGQVDGLASQSSSLNSGLPSGSVGVSVGEDCGGKFTGSWIIKQLASPVIGFLCCRPLEP